MSITKETMTAFQKDIRDAMDAIAARHNLRLVGQSGRFNPADATVRLKLVPTAEAKAIETEEELELRRRFPDMVGKRYRTALGLIEPYGWNPRAQKYPFLYRQVRNGSIYKAHATMVSQCIPVNEI